MAIIFQFSSKSFFTKTFSLKSFITPYQNIKILMFCITFIVMTFLVRECYGSPKKHENSLKVAKIRAEECFDKVLNEEF